MDQETRIRFSHNVFFIMNFRVPSRARTKTSKMQEEAMKGVQGPLVVASALCTDGYAVVPEKMLSKNINLELHLVGDYKL